MSSFALSPLSVTVVACVLTLALTPALRAAARRLGLLDRPNPRSSHQTVVPRGGGVAIALGSLGALALAGTGLGGRATPVLLGAVALAAVGLCDDRFSLPAGVRVAAQLLVAFAVVFALGGLDRAPLPSPLDVPLGAAGAAVAVVWIVAVVNFYNFLDGIDGLAALQGLLTGLGVALAGWDPFASLVGAALAGGCAAFLLFNWSPARIFLGDVGSLLLGFAFAALPLLAAPADRPRALFFVALSLWLFLADAAFTLVRRFARGARWHEAHREHLYQRLVASGSSHRAVALALGGGALLLTAAALLGWRGGNTFEFAAALAALALFAAEWRAVRVRERPPAAGRGAAA